MSDSKPAREGKASREELYALWSKLLECMLDRMSNPPAGGLSPSFLAVVSAFLRDNGATAAAMKSAAGQAEALAKLASSVADMSLPFDALDETPAAQSDQDHHPDTHQ